MAGPHGIFVPPDSRAGTPSRDRLLAEVELVGTNLRIEPATDMVSLDVSMRNVSRFGLSNPAQVWLGNLAPAGIEVLNGR